MTEKNVINTCSSSARVSSSHRVSGSIAIIPPPHFKKGKLIFQGHKANVGAALMSLRADIELDDTPCMLTAISPELSD